MSLLTKPLPGSKIIIVKLIICFTIFYSMAVAETGSDPSGMSTASVVYNNSINAANSNPAILGAELKP